MASYSIRWKHSAIKELRRMDRAAVPKLLAAVAALADEPMPNGCKKLQGADHLWRIRVGEYRVVYSVDSGVLSIEVIRVGHRQSVYRR